MRYSTYQSIYEPMNSELVKSNIGNYKKVLARFKISSWMLKVVITSMIIFIGCSTVLTVFAGNENAVLPGGKIAVSQGKHYGVFLWNINRRIWIHVYI